MKKIFVAGASGFTGREIAAHLAGHPEFSVVAGLHTTPLSEDLAKKVTTAPFNLQDASTLEAPLKGVDTVVFCAAGSRAVSVNGAQALLTAARNQGVRRFIYLGCTSYYGLTGGTVHEAAPPKHDDHTIEAREKAEVESLCRAAAGSSMSVVILRAAQVLSHGGISSWGKVLTQRLRARKWGRIGIAGEGTANILDIRDLAAAVEAAILRDEAAGKTYNVNGPEQITWNAFFDKYNQAMEFPYTRDMKMEMIGFRVLGAGPLKAVSDTIPLFRSKAREALLGAPSFYELDLYRLKAVYPTEAITRDLGWTPSVPLHKSIADAATWARNNKTAWMSL
ncbi:NAD(P)-dependent oxidoreductase [Phaeovibrio sulfidiphilus]|uniref:NAD(P)-dependent oxidoreductase n=1 Tax=Phaeovibrio sulfidiphilus TaxID=1220600 RepID=A0A8J7CDG8_9PROT|nr:NAD(P)-dependent oxidoreductase [Phaeovibrio sulfidiphilus]MBE1237009.1 NAD(P)-dependent oxidoreductase [Phaeovibrio sulfidiphilus]